MKMNRNSIWTYIGFALLISLGGCVSLVILRSVTSDILWLFIGATGIGLATYFLTIGVKAFTGRQAIKSKRAMGQKILMVVVMSFILSIGVIELLTSFLFEGELFVVIDGVNYLDLDFAYRYAWVYGLIYAILAITTILLVNA